MAEVVVKNLKYELRALLSSGEIINMTNLILAMNWGDQEGELAQRASLTLANTRTEKGYICDILSLCTMLFIYANGSEVFRGLVWEWCYSSSSQKEIRITAYDKLIYAAKSMDNSYYSAGKSTQDIVSDLCSRWNIPLDYQWENFTHEKILYRNQAVSEQIMATLDDAQKKIDSKYTAIMEQDVLKIRKRGNNSDIFVFNTQNVIGTSDRLTLDQLVTQVIIVGKADDEGRRPVEHTEPGATEFGILQTIVTKNSDQTLEDAKKEAREILNNDGKPKETISIDAPDVPQLRKGDKVKISAGNLSGYFIILSVTHSAVSRTMTMELERE